MSKIQVVILSASICVVYFMCLVQAETTQTPEMECALLNDSCEKCVSNKNCLWCPLRDDACSPYPKSQLIPNSEYCGDLSKARWGTCWLNYKALLITMGTFASIIVLLISCCCIYCCCCRGNAKAKRKLHEDEAKFEQERVERDAKHAEKRAERQSKYDEIRMKYGIGKAGLVKDTSPYQKFENE